VKYVALLHRYGLSVTFINSLDQLPGPLYAFVHMAFEPLTRLQPVRMRILNVVLLAAVAGILALSERRRKQPDWRITAASVLAVPMMWVVAGMALTEVPAMLFVALSLYLQVMGLESLQAGGRLLRLFVASGICLGIAVWGRQPYLLLIGAVALLALMDQRLRAPALGFAGAVALVVLPLFTIWGGVVPPAHRGVFGGSLTHGLVSLGYTGFCLMLLAPRFGWPSAQMLIALLATTVVSWGRFTLYPIRSVVERHLTGPVLLTYGRLCGALFLGLGAAFLVVLLQSIWRHRKDLRMTTVAAGLLCIATSPMFDVHQYSSRYTAMSLPYLILAAQSRRIWGWKVPVGFILGSAAGFLSLRGYFTG
jgi:hypothetical protein